MIEAKSGGDVNGYQYAPIPYHETFGYDAFSNLTARQSDQWNGSFSDNDSASYTDNRRLGWSYDSDGRNTTIGTRTYKFDAVGRQTLMTAQQMLPNGHHIQVSETSGYDADGVKVYDAASGVINYYLRSSVLGGAIIEEIGSNGQKNVGYVYSAMGTELAQQSSGSVNWKHNTPAGTSQYTMVSSISAIGRIELDPLGADVSITAPAEPPPSEGNGDVGAGHFAGLMDARWSDFFNLSSGCSKAGVAASCSGPLANSNLAAQERAFFGSRWYDLPGNANERARGEERYDSIRAGYDPAFNRLVGSVTVTYASGAVETKKNPTLDEYQRLETAYLADSGYSDLETNTVTVYGGAEYFISPQNPDSFQQAVDKAVAKSKAILQADNDCSKFFGPNAVAALEALAKKLTLASNYKQGITTNTGISQSYDSTIVVNGPNNVVAYRLPTSAEVYRNGPFFMSPGAKSIGGYHAGSMGAQVTSILHEVAHDMITDPKKYTPLIPNDGTDPSLSNKNTQTILNHCSKEIFNAAK
jgi:hypothetical protein